MDDRSSPQSKQAPDKPAPPKKSSMLRKLLIIVVAVLLIGTFATGVFLGPKLVAKLPGAKKAEPASVEKEEPPAGAVAQLDSIVVDLHESTGEMHHLKVGIAIELAGNEHGEEFKRYEPRARDAAISYLRSLTFEEVTNVTQLEHIRTALLEHIGASVGKSLVRKVLFTDFVAQ